MVCRHYGARGRCLAHPHGGRHAVPTARACAGSAARRRARGPRDAGGQDLRGAPRGAAACRRSSTGAATTGSCCTRSASGHAWSPTPRVACAACAEPSALEQVDAATRRCLRRRHDFGRHPLGEASAGWLSGVRPPAPEGARRSASRCRSSPRALEMLFPVLTRADRRPRCWSTAATRISTVSRGDARAALSWSLAVTMVQRCMLSRAAVDIDVQALDYLTARCSGLPMSYFASRRTGDIERRLDGVRGRSANSGPGRDRRPDRGDPARRGTRCHVRLQRGADARVFLAHGARSTAGLMRYSSRACCGRRSTSLEEEYGRYCSQPDRRDQGHRDGQGDRGRGAHAGSDARARTFARLDDRMFRLDFTSWPTRASPRWSPSYSLACSSWSARSRSIAADLTVGGLVAFNSLIALANAPARARCSGCGTAAESSVLLDRLKDIFEHEPEQGRPVAAHRRCPRSRAGSGCGSVGFRYGDARVAADPRRHLPRRPARADGRHRRPQRLAARHADQAASRGCSEPTEGTIHLDGVDLSELACRDLRRQHRLRPAGEPTCSTTRSRATSPSASREPDVDRVRWAAAAGQRARLHRAAAARLRDPDRRERASRSPAARRSGSRSRGRSTTSPPILIFDEATSALDTESERARQANLDADARADARFVIAHRLSTIRDADLIIVLEEGRAGRARHARRADGAFKACTRI